MRGAQHDRVHLLPRRVDAGRLRRRLVLLDREQRPAEARALDVERHDHRGDEQDHRQHHVAARIGELGVGERILALHRQRHFLVAHPLEDVEHRERVREHRQREVVAAEAEGRDADDDRRDHADRDAERDPEPRRDAELHERDRHRVAAEPEERGLAERDHAAVAAQHVPAEAHRRPDQDEGHDQLVVGVADQQPEQEVRDGERGDHAVLLPRPAVQRPVVTRAPRCGRTCRAARRR